MDIIFATKNQGKITELQELLKDMSFNIKTISEVGLDIDIIEDGETFEENSMKKAVEVMRLSGVAAIADDSGLEIDFFDKKPGVLSARFLGADTPYVEKNKIVLEMMAKAAEHERTARFISVITAAFPDGRLLSSKGVLEGRISYEAKGNNGFGYDPIFLLPELNKTLAEIDTGQKNKISHRGKALELMKDKLRSIGVSGKC